jgi:hypothetical protein
MKYITLFFICCALFLMSCQTGTKGGNGDIIYTQKTETIDENNKPVVTTTTVTNKVEQPESAKGSAISEVVVKPDGTAIITNSTGGSYNISQIMGEISLLRIVTYAGIGLILIGLVVGWLFKDIKWGIIIGICGAGMVAGSYLLAKYAAIFLILVLVLIAYGVWFIIDRFKQQRSNDENVKVIDVLKETGAVEPEKVAKVANIIQSKATKKIVKKVKEKKL